MDGNNVSVLPSNACEELGRLRRENEAQQSKIKCYKTLHDQYQEKLRTSQEENEFLRSENDCLKRCQALSANDTKTTDDDDDLEEDSFPSLGPSNEARSIDETEVSICKQKPLVNGHENVYSENIDASLKSHTISSLDVNNMVGQFSQSVGVASSPALKDSVTTALHIAKLEKDKNMYKEHNRALLQENKQLRSENNQLRNATHVEGERLQTTPMSSLSSNGWVNVRPQTNDVNFSKAHATYASEDIDQTKVLGMTELGTDAVLVKYKQHIDKLASANQKWEEHGKKQQEDFDRQISYIEKEKDDLTRQVKELRSIEEKRQVEIDRILLSAKKKYQDEETLKEDALQELHIANVQVDQLQKHIRTLEGQVHEHSVVVQETPRLDAVSSQQLDVNIQSLQEEIGVLKQQITTYQEDFENERRDRERIQQLKEQYKEMLDNMKVDKGNVDRQLANQNRTLEHLRQMKQEVEFELNLARRELSELRRAVINPAPAPPAPYQHPVPTWNCVHCTYENHGQRTYCEICGRPGRPAPAANLFGYQSSRLMVDKRQPMPPRGRDMPDVNGDHDETDGRPSGSCPDPGDLENDNGGKG